MTILLLFSILSFTLERSFEVQASDFAMDSFGHYYLYEKQYLEKRDSQGKLLFRNSGLDYGTITSVDLTNPMQPMVFYGEQGKVAFLDNTLSVQGNVIDLFEYGYGQIECIGGSRGDAFWIWDVNRTELIRVNKRFERLNSSGNISLLLSRKINPDQIIESGQYVYVSDPGYGILIFDIYGNYRSGVPVSYEGKIQINEEKIIYVSGNQLYAVTVNSLQPEQYEIPLKDFVSVRFFAQKLHILSDRKISVFRFG